MRGTAVNYRLYREQAEADHAARAGLNLKSGNEPNRAARAGLCDGVESESCVDLRRRRWWAGGVEGKEGGGGMKKVPVDVEP
jgi:hypothetical protein